MPAKERKDEERPLPAWAVQSVARDATEVPLVEASLPAWAGQGARKRVDDDELFGHHASEPDEAMEDDVRRAMELERGRFEKGQRSCEKGEW